MSPSEIKSHRLQLLLQKYLSNPSINIMNEALAIGVSAATARDYQKTILQQVKKMGRV